MKPPLTAEYLRSILDYDPLSGIFVWRIRTSNRVKVGDIAGSVGNHGYIVIRIDGQNRLAHRLAWLYMLGTFPPDGIDHKDCDRQNNSWENLRHATGSQNQGNICKRADNTSGYRGVSWHKKSGKWQACVKVSGKNYHLGFYDEPAYAAAVHAGAHKLIHGDFSHSTVNITINNYFAQQQPE